MKRIDDVWDACPEGELVQLANALRQTHWFRIVGSTAAVIAVGMVALTLVGVLATFFVR